MSTLAITIPVTNGDAGALLRRLAQQIEKAAAPIPDRVASGASIVLTIDNAPSAGLATVQITAGPYTTAVLPV